MKITALVVADRATALWKLRSALYLADRCEMWDEGRACLVDRALRAKEGAVAEALPPMRREGPSVAGDQEGAADPHVRMPELAHTDRQRPP